MKQEIIASQGWAFFHVKIFNTKLKQRRWFEPGGALYLTIHHVTLLSPSSPRLTLSGCGWRSRCLGRGGVIDGSVGTQRRQRNMALAEEGTI